MTDVCIMREFDAAIASQAKRRKLAAVVCRSTGALEFERALVVEAGTAIPWELVKHGLHFVTLWDAAVPLWKYNVLAASQGTAKERKLTKALTLDLRIPVYASELLFVSGNKAGRALLAAWEEERAKGKDARLAFLRAVARVKPRLCTLPATWLGHVRVRRSQETRTARAVRASKPERVKRAKKKVRKVQGMVRVEMGPGRFVQCRPENAERVKRDFEERQIRRADRGGRR